MPVPATVPELLPVLEELSAREPIFHRPAFASTPADFDTLMAPDYYEIGASGKLYDRDFILDHLTHNPPIDAATTGWQASNFHCRRLAPDLYLLTYTLAQPDRRTRRTRHTLRSTLWHSTPSGWQILFHQGTVIKPT